MTGITVFFGLFGHRSYRRYQVVDADLGAAQIPCRWCIGSGYAPRCVACKGTGRMWISI